MYLLIAHFAQRIEISSLTNGNRNEAGNKGKVWFLPSGWIRWQYKYQEAMANSNLFGSVLTATEQAHFVFYINLFTHSFDTN